MIKRIVCPVLFLAVILQGCALRQGCVGQIIDKLDQLGLAENTLVIFSSDNGPAQNNGYHDGTDEISFLHKPSGPYRGGNTGIKRIL